MQDSGAVDTPNVVEQQFVHLTVGKVFATRDIANNGGIPFGGLVRLVLPPESPAPPCISTRPPVRCMKCCAYLHRHCRVDRDTGVWHCPMCLHSNMLETAALLDIDTWPEMVHDAVDYVRHTSDVPPTPPPLLLLMIDLTLQPHQLKQACDALSEYIGQVEQPVALLLYGATICAMRVADGNEANAVHMDVLGSATPTAVGRLDVHNHIGQLPRDAGKVQALLQSVRHVSSPQRCLGNALQVALELVSQFTTITDDPSGTTPAGFDLHTLCHMCCIAGGPPTVGPGTPRGDGDAKQRQWYTELGTRVGLARCCVDVWMWNGDGERDHLGVVLGPLCSRTGGVLQEVSDLSPLTPTILTTCMTRRIATLAAVDIRCSPYLRVAEMLGPCTRLPDHARQGLGAQPNLFSPNTHVLAGVEAGQGLGFLIGLSADLPPGSCAHVQVCCSWRQQGVMGVERVITLALDTTDDVAAYLHSVHSAVAAALVAKRILTAAVTGEAAYDRKRASELCRGLGMHLRFLAGRFGGVAEDQRGRGWLSRRRQTLPAVLFEFAQALYFLQHTVLLAPTPHTRDRQALYQTTALNAPATTPCLTPRVWVVRDGVVHQRPPLMLSLCGEDAVVVDVGVEVFVWLGAGVEAFGGAAQALQQCMQVVQTQCVGGGHGVPLRCPLPLVRRVRDVEVLQELLGCLNPVQHDTVGVQRGLWLRSVPGGVVPTMDDALASVQGEEGQSMHEWAEGVGVALLL